MSSEGKKPGRQAARESGRQERIEAQRRRQKARGRKRLLTYGTVVVVILALAGFGIQRYVTKRSRAEVATKAAGCSPVKELKSLGAQHVPPEQAPKEYNSTPATSGPHGPIAPWGSGSETLEPYQYVHNLEHGGVIIQYKGLSDGEIERLEDLADSYSEGVLLMPNEQLESSLAVGAWTRLQTCERVTVEAVQAFIDTRCGKGPEKIVTCRRA